MAKKPIPNIDLGLSQLDWLELIVTGRIQKAIEATIDRATSLMDIPYLVKPFVISKLDTEIDLFDLDYIPGNLAAIATNCRLLADKLSAILDKEWTTPNIQSALDTGLKNSGWEKKAYYMMVRVAITGRSESPGIVETVYTIGQLWTVRRLRMFAEECIKLPGWTRPVRPDCQDQ